MSRKPDDDVGRTRKPGVSAPMPPDSKALGRKPREGNLQTACTKRLGLSHTPLQLRSATSLRPALPPQVHRRRVSSKPDDDVGRY